MSAPDANGQRPHVHVVADDVFFPSNSGGRVEVLESTRALHHAGFAVSCTIMQREQISEGDVRRNTAEFPGTLTLHRPGFLATTMRHPFLPYQLASRLFADVPRTLDTPPDIVVAHHEWALPYARRIAREHGARLVLRSHNDELEYLRSLRNPAPWGVRRAYYSAELARARRAFRAGFYEDVALALTISEADQRFYRDRGVAVATMPPSLGLASAKPVEEIPEGKGIVFAGSMDMPYVVAGLRWFVAEVLPRIVEKDPDVRFHVMGRRAPQALADELGGNGNVTFLGEVDDTVPHLRQARVFVNPVFEGSGLNMKMGPPSALGIPIVTTTVGARGLGDLAALFDVADDDAGFAEGCLRHLAGGQLWQERSRKLVAASASYSRDAVARQYREAFESL
ncbi:MULTISPECIES: glycosyltransferase family 4 protein [Bacteria]|uniref:glycosyltransferase family 4 protein n=1 Tax=Bacteria TaxID=2 RepID=UPI003C7AA5E4